MNAVLRYLRRVRRTTVDPVLIDRVDREIRRECPCYLHRSKPIEPIACICECDHAPCGHPIRVKGCGGCDPAATEDVCQRHPIAPAGRCPWCDAEASEKRSSPGERT